MVGEKKGECKQSGGKTTVVNVFKAEIYKCGNFLFGHINLQTSQSQHGSFFCKFEKLNQVYLITFESQKGLQGHCNVVSENKNNIAQT